MERKTWFYLILGLQIFLLIGMIGFKYSTLIFGEKVLLKTTPVDPRSLFRGDYVILTYEISSLDTEKIITDSSDFKRGDPVYVKLIKGEKFWDAYLVTKVKPGGGVFIKGKVVGLWNNNLRIEYGTESYFVPEGKGRVIERERGKESLAVEVSVDRFGNSVINQIYLDDEPLVFD